MIKLIVSTTAYVAVLVFAFLVIPGKASAQKLPAYQITININCKYSLDFFDDGGKKGLALQSGGSGQCELTIPEKVSAIGNLLDKLQKSGLKISDYAIFSLGPVEQSEWNERYAECFIRNAASNEKNRIYSSKYISDQLNRCDVFRELCDMFIRYGLMISVNSVEDVITLGAPRTRPYTNTIATWIARHRRLSQKLPSSSLVWFNINKLR